jgi:hypothetical protein
LRWSSKASLPQSNRAARDTCEAQLCACAFSPGFKAGAFVFDHGPGGFWINTLSGARFFPGFERGSPSFATRIE